MPPDNVEHLREAATRKRQVTRRRVEQTLKEMDDAGTPVSVAAVSKAAGVSRSWIYETPDVLEAIVRRREAQQRSGPGVPAAQQASEASLRERLATALEDNRRLRSEVSELRELLALAHGERLEREVSQ